MSDLDLVVIGDINPDLVISAPDLRVEFGQREALADSADLHLGGSAAITACAASRLGLRVAFCGLVGDDQYGGFCLAAMQEHGVDTAAVRRDRNVSTGLTVILQRDGDRAIVTHLGSIGTLSRQHLDREVIGRARHVHVGSYFLLDGLRDELPGLFDDLRAAGTTTSLDTNDDPRGTFDVDAMLDRCDVLLPNEAEARRMTGAESTSEAAARLARRVGTIVVTTAAGALARRGADVVDARRATRRAGHDRRHHRSRRQLRRRVPLRLPARMGSRSLGGRRPVRGDPIADSGAVAPAPSRLNRLRPMAEVELRGVGKTFPNGFEALHDLSLTVADGEFLVLVGPSGCGKSTALNIVAGLETCTTGDVRVGDRVVTHEPPKRRDVAMVFQDYALYPHMTVARNIGFPLELAKVNKAEIRARVAEAARILDLHAQLGKKPGQLSGGQKQRVAMGRAIVRRPSVFLMDEPLSNLDAKLRVQMRTEIARLQAELEVTTIYVTHDQVEAMTMGDRVAVMLDGRLQQLDTPKTLYAAPAEPVRRRVHRVAGDEPGARQGRAGR